MMSMRHLVSCLAFAAAAGLGVTAWQGGIGADALHAMDASFDSNGDVAASTGALEEIADMALGGGITNAGDWRMFSGLPLTGAIKTDDGEKAVHISAYYGKDKRGKYSYYVATSVELHKAVVFLFDVESNGLLLQAVENRAHYPVTDGMFLGSHRYYAEDKKYDGMVRLIVHADVNKAVIWQFVTVDGKRYLQVKENRDYTAPDTAGWYVAVPPDSARDKNSNYLAITPDLEKAMAVEVVAIDD